MASSNNVVEQIKKLGPCGGPGGRPFSMNIDGVSRIVKIIIRHSDSIGNINISYISNGREKSTGQLGSGGGNFQTTQIDLKPDEYITSVSGYFGNIQSYILVRSLKFQTNLRSTIGPFGQNSGIPFELSAKHGQIIGFHGMYGSYLDALGVYVKAPPMEEVIKKVGPFGGDGGSVKDMDPQGISRIVMIKVRHASSINAFTVHFIRNGREESTDQWGGPGGFLTEIEFQPNEYITSVKGYIGNNVVRSLRFETNIGGSYGPYGREQGTPFELEANGGQIIAFHGRSGEFLNSLGAYVKASTIGELITKVGPCGGPNGAGAVGMDVNGISRIVKIIVRHSDCIGSILTHFIRNGREESTTQWGTGTGADFKVTEVNLEPNEYITSVKGHFGRIRNAILVRSLKFETNLRSSEPLGQEQGVPFELPAINGQIIGFHGFSGSYLDAIGVFAKVGGTTGLTGL